MCVEFMSLHRYICLRVAHFPELSFEAFRVFLGLRRNENTSTISWFTHPRCVNKRSLAFNGFGSRQVQQNVSTGPCWLVRMCCSDENVIFLLKYGPVFHYVAIEHQQVGSSEAVRHVIKKISVEAPWSRLKKIKLSQHVFAHVKT